MIGTDEQVRPPPFVETHVTGRDEDIEDVAILIDGPSERVPLASHTDKYLVEVPRIARLPSALPSLLNKRLAEYETPAAGRFVADRDTPFGPQFFDLTRAE